MLGRHPRYIDLGTAGGTRELTAIVARRGKPCSIVSDNGTEFTCNAMLTWCNDTSIDWHFIAPGNRYRTPSSRASTAGCATKNNGYHLEHNFGYGKQNLAMLFAAINLLAFAMHTVCDCLEDL
jgi:transposase InsO family protein